MSQPEIVTLPSKIFSITSQYQPLLIFTLSNIAYISDKECPGRDADDNEPRTQFNALTSFLDLSAIYGSESAIATRLKAESQAIDKPPYGIMMENPETNQEHNLPTRCKSTIELTFMRN